MEVKVNVKFSSWPYEETLSYIIDEEAFQNMDTIVDSLISNLKVRMLFYVKQNHPTLWYKYSPGFNPELLKKLTLDANSN